MSKLKKFVKVSLIVLVTLALLIGIGFSVFYFSVTARRFEYSNCAWFEVNIPFFCNPLLSNEPGIYLGYPFDWAGKEINVYTAVNGPLQMWAINIQHVYEGEDIDIGYNVENDGKMIKVNFSGTAGDTPIEKEFVFDIQNASPDNLPEWTNRVEADDEFMVI